MYVHGGRDSTFSPARYSIGCHDDELIIRQREW